MSLFIGTSGWQYRDWRDRFYPSGLPQKRWLEHYAERSQTVESNSAFYRLPARTTFADWARPTPDDIVMAVKMSRYLTHIKPPGRRVRAGSTLPRARCGLDAKLGPVLLQLPPTLKADHDLLNACLRRFPQSVRVAVEFPSELVYRGHPTHARTERRCALLCGPWLAPGFSAVGDRGLELSAPARGCRVTSPLLWALCAEHLGAATCREMAVG